MGAVVDSVPIQLRRCVVLVVGFPTVGRCRGRRSHPTAASLCRAVLPSSSLCRTVLSSSSLCRPPLVPSFSRLRVIFLVVFLFSAWFPLLLLLLLLFVLSLRLFIASHSASSSSRPRFASVSHLPSPLRCLVSFHFSSTSSPFSSSSRPPLLVVVSPLLLVVSLLRLVVPGLLYTISPDLLVVFVSPLIVVVSRYRFVWVALLGRMSEGDGKMKTNTSHDVCRGSCFVTHLLGLPLQGSPSPVSLPGFSVERA